MAGTKEAALRRWADFKKRGVYEAVCKKMSDAQKRITEEGKRNTSGEKNGMYGKTPWNKGKPFLALEKNPNWRGGLSFMPYNMEWTKKLRESIRQRDGCRCQICFRSRDELKQSYTSTYKQELRIHHIDYDKQNNNPWNLVSTCVMCHVKTNFNREHWMAYFRERLALYLNQYSFICGGM